MADETSSTHEQVATLKARVFALVRACPEGRVTTYGWFATDRKAGLDGARTVQQ